MNKCNNTGQLSQVMILMLILASAIVLLLFVTKFVARSTMDESISACRLSVMTQAATTYGIITKTSPLDINCDKRYVNFYNTRAELGLSLENMNPINIDFGDHKAKKFSELNEFIVDQVIAEELRVCKFEFGDGKIKIFPNDKSGIFSGKKVCFVCSEINFKSGVDQKEFTNLVEYTKKTTFTDAGMSYYKYLTETTISGNAMWSQPVDSKNLGSLNIDSTKTYLIYAQKVDPSVTASWYYTDGIYIGITSQENINTYCDLQAS